VLGQTSHRAGAGVDMEVLWGNVVLVEEAVRSDGGWRWPAMVMLFVAARQVALRGILAVDDGSRMGH
jgi:hypothetical protein